MVEMRERTIKLGLIGDNIAQSKSPRLHRAAGKISNIKVTYDRLVPKDLDLTFDQTFDLAKSTGYRGLNITYPYKALVTHKVSISDPLVAAIGAVNTVVFAPEGPQGYNTDYSGFISAYRTVMRQTSPGTVCLIGAGGVGKAVAFSLLALKATTLRCVDLDPAKAQALATALSDLGSQTQIDVFTDPVAAAKGVDGVINCTPLGMAGIGGTPLPRTAMAGAKWAFDAVYTPVDTDFLKDAKAQGLTLISGYELFFGQGIDAWKIFTGTAVDTAALRAALQEDA